MSAPAADPRRDKGHPTGWAQAPLEARISALDDPVRLDGTTRSGRAARVWACGVCFEVRLSKDDAVRCYRCAPSPCEHGLRPRGNLCDACEEERSIARAHKLEAAAKRVPEVEYDGDYVTDGDIFESSVADLLDQLEDREPDEPFPTTLWGTKPETPKVDLDRVLDWVAEGTTTPEDCDPPEFNGVAELQKAVDEFNKLQPPWCWVMDTTVLIEVDPRHERERLARRAAERADTGEGR